MVKICSSKGNYVTVIPSSVIKIYSSKGTNITVISSSVVEICSSKGNCITRLLSYHHLWLKSTALKKCLHCSHYGWLCTIKSFLKEKKKCWPWSWIWSVLFKIKNINWSPQLKLSALKVSLTWITVWCKCAALKVLLAWMNLNVFDVKDCKTCLLFL